MTQIPPASEPTTPQGVPQPAWPGQPPATWWGVYPQPHSPQPPGFIPLKVQVWAAVEVALGALFIGGILVSQANWTTYSGEPVIGGQLNVSGPQLISGAPWYLTAWAFVAGIALAVALGVAVRALLSAGPRRIAWFRSTQLAVVAAGFALAAGYTLMTQIAGWTSNCQNGCVLPEQGANVNTVVSSLAIDAGAGLVAALLPAALWLWCRGREDAPVPAEAATPRPQ